MDRQSRLDQVLPVIPDPRRWIPQRILAKRTEELFLGMPKLDRRKPSLLGQYPRSRQRQCSDRQKQRRQKTLSEARLGNRSCNRILQDWQGPQHLSPRYLHQLRTLLASDRTSRLGYPNWNRGCAVASKSVLRHRSEKP